MLNDDTSVVESIQYDNEDGDNNMVIEDSNDNKHIINEDDIIKLREELIDKAMEELFLKREDAIIAMLFLKWNSDKFDEWYEDTEQSKVKAGIELSDESKNKFEESKIKLNGNKCLICGDERNEKFRSLNCGHQFCPECWKDYLSVKIKLPLNALQVTCPQFGCNCIVYESFYSLFLDNSTPEYKIFQKAVYKNFISRNEDIQQCPNPECNLYYKSDCHMPREIICSCGTSYCFRCSQNHIPCTCEMFEKWNKMDRPKISYESDEMKNLKWIEAYTKECPNCHQKIEKKSGCNYMLCDGKAGGCGFAFCYVCECPWQSHNNHYICNNQTQEVLNKQKYQEKLKKEIEKESFISDDSKKDIHYSIYFYNYYESKIENLEKKSKEEFKIYIYAFCITFTSSDTEFIFENLDKIIMIEKIIKNSYILEYCLKDKEKKKLLEKERDKLLLQAEKILDLFAKLRDIFLRYDSDFAIDLDKIKKELYVEMFSTEVEKNKFIDYIERNLMDDIDEEILSKKIEE